MKFNTIILFLFLFPIHLCLFAQNDIQNYKIKVGLMPLKFKQGIVLSEKERKEYTEYLDKIIPIIFDSLQKKSADFEFVGRFDSTMLPQSNLLLMQQEIEQQSGKRFGLGDTINVLITSHIDGYTKKVTKLFGDLDFKITKETNRDFLTSACFSVLPLRPAKKTLDVNIKKIGYLIDVKGLKGKNKLEQNLNSLFDRTLLSYRILDKTFLLVSKDDKKLFKLIKDKILLELSYKEENENLIFEINPKTTSKKFIRIDMKGNPIQTSFKIDKKRFESGDYLDFIIQVFNLIQGFGL